MSVEENVECPTTAKANLSCITVQGSQVSGTLNVDLPADNIQGELTNPTFSLNGGVCDGRGTNMGFLLGLTIGK
jgi:hypothetical protein